MQVHFQSFKVTEVDAINKFLVEHTDGISPGNIKYIGDSICFMYVDNTTDEEKKKESLILSIKDFMGKRQAEVLGKQIDIGHWRRMAARGVKQAAEQVVNQCNELENLILQIQDAENILNEVVAGTWKGDKLENSVAPAPKKKAK